jgi:hypothetical protein
VITNVKHYDCTCLFSSIMLHAIFSPLGLTAPSGPNPPHCWGFKITLRHTTLGTTPGRVIGPSRSPVLDHTQHTTHTHTHTHTIDRHPSPWRDSNPRSKRASGRRPTT